MSYVQLLLTKIPKTLKDTDDLTVFFALWGSSRIQVACKTLVKSTPGFKQTTSLLHDVMAGSSFGKCLSVWNVKKVKTLVFILK